MLSKVKTYFSGLVQSLEGVAAALLGGSSVDTIPGAVKKLFASIKGLFVKAS